MKNIPTLRITKNMDKAFVLGPVTPRHVWKQFRIKNSDEPVLYNWQKIS